MNKRFLAKHKLLKDGDAQHIMRGTGCSYALALGYTATQVATLTGHVSHDTILKSYNHSVIPPVPPTFAKMMPISLAFQYALLVHESNKNG